MPVHRLPVGPTAPEISNPLRDVPRSRVTLMLKVRRPRAASLSLLPPPEHAGLDQ